MSFIEEETQWLRTVILPKVLANGRLLDNYDEAQASTFNVLSIDITLIAFEESFMVTKCYRATIDFEYAGVQHKRKFVVKKTPPLPASTYEMIHFDELFGNEVETYTNILPVMCKIARGKFHTANYYYSEIKPQSALVVLDDFAFHGWSMTKDKVGLNLKHARIAVKYLGKFHGLAYILKHNDNERFLEFASKLREPRFIGNELHPILAMHLRVSLERAVKSVYEYQPQIDVDFVEKWIQLVNDYNAFGRQCVAPREPLATFCHGDFLRNNVAFKYETVGGVDVPIDMIMFDFQTLRLSSPMIDLTIFLATSVYADVRHENFDIIFDDYYSALVETYQLYSGKPLPEFLSHTTLIKEYVRLLPYSIRISSFFLMHLVSSHHEIFADLNSSNDDSEKTIMTLGGETVDREIAHQFKEMFDLSKQFNVQLDKM